MVALFSKKQVKINTYFREAADLLFQTSPAPRFYLQSVFASVPFLSPSFQIQNCCVGFFFLHLHYPVGALLLDTSRGCLAVIVSPSAVCFVSNQFFPEVFGVMETCAFLRAFLNPHPDILVPFSSHCNSSPCPHSYSFVILGYLFCLVCFQVWG